LDTRVKAPQQAAGMHLPAGLLAGLRERLQKSLPVLVIGKNAFPPVAAIHHVIDRGSILNAQLPSRASRVTKPPRCRHCNIAI
jgi:hypothetical protein